MQLVQHFKPDSSALDAGLRLVCMVTDCFKNGVADFIVFQCVRNSCDWRYYKKIRRVYALLELPFTNCFPAGFRRL